MLNEIKNRRAVRKYKPDPVSKEDIIEIIKAGQFAPNGQHTQAWEFLVIEDQRIKEKLFQIVGQDFVKEAPVLIIPVIASKSVTPVQDLSLVSGNIFLQATSLGLATVWKNVRPEFEEKVKEILKIPNDFMVINIIPLGYPAEEIGPHEDSDFNENKIHWGNW